QHRSKTKKQERVGRWRVVASTARSKAESSSGSIACNAGGTRGRRNFPRRTSVRRQASEIKAEGGRQNVQRSTSNAERSKLEVGSWTLDVGRWTLDVGRWTFPQLGLSI